MTEEPGMLTQSPERKAIGQMFVDEGLITNEQLEAALEQQRQQGGKLGEILVRQGLITPEDVASSFSIQLNVPLIDLKRHMIQPEALGMIPEPTARQHTLIPVDIVGGSLLVAMAHPEDIPAVEDIRARIKVGVDVALASAADIEEAINLNYRSSINLEQHLGEYQFPEAEDASSAHRLSARTPIAETLDMIIRQGVRDRASDIHIEPQAHSLRIRYRIDGSLHDVSSLPAQVHGALVSRIKILAEMNIGERRRSQDGQFSVQVGSKEVDIRAATMETSHGERVTLRILDKSGSLLSLPDLGLLPEDLETYGAILRSPFGMILVSGPTGSGKTTTLYASISLLDRNERNILTIEDPIEYTLDGISQTQVNTKAGITFASGLRAALRNDPDDILVGEIRDRDTAVTAVQAALTGHLVLSSIHSTDTLGTLVRLTDLGVEPYLVASTLVGVVAQRMVRRLCTRCAVPVRLSSLEQRAYAEEMGHTLETSYKGEGCGLCSGTGYRGRTGLFELFTMSDGVRGMLLDGASASAMRDQARREGMKTMKHDGMMKVDEGVTTVSEVVRTVFSVS